MSAPSMPNYVLPVVPANIPIAMQPIHPSYQILGVNPGRMMYTPQSNAGQPGDVPYAIGYTPAHRRCVCQACKQYIDKNDIRISSRYPSAHHDGFCDQWYHEKCFWDTLKIDPQMEINERSIKDFDWLSLEDQQRITSEIDKLYPDKVEPSRGYHKKVVLIDYMVEETKTCMLCHLPHQKYDLVLMAIGFSYTQDFQCYHFECLANSGLFQGSASDFIGFSDLSDENQAYLLHVFINGQQDNPVQPPSDTVRGARTMLPEKDKPERVRNLGAYSTQNFNMCRIRKALMNMPPSYWSDALKMNDLCLPLTEGQKWLSTRSGTNSGEDDVIILNYLTDCIQFGVPKPCSKCSTPNHEKFIAFDTESQMYRCSGHISSYTACTYAERNPIRRPLTIPSNMTLEMSDVRDIRCQSVRTISLYLSSMPKLLISSKGNVNNSQMVAKQVEMMKNKTQTVHVKNGCQVDSLTLGHEHLHVYIDPVIQMPWQVMLSQTNLSLNKNLVFKAQLLEHDTMSRYFIFTCFGNVGSDSCSFNTRMLDDDLEAAKREFANHFEERTGNKWDDYMHGLPFQKKPGKFNIIDVMVDTTMEDQKIETPIEDMTLSQPVRELVHKMFDLKAMKNSLISMDIDLNRLPLKNLSDKQINLAYQVLSALERAISNHTSTTSETFLDLTNQFYTLIPHDTGNNQPVIMSSLDVVKRKTEMLDQLRQVAQSYMIASRVVTPAGERIVANYQTLKCKIAELPESSGEYQRLATYAHNGYDNSYSHYYTGRGQAASQLRIVSIYRIDREAEQGRVDGWNRMLLWHGSPISNFVGILTRGLKIAPKEAPHTGYSLGKGVYFADVISKSLGYCRVIHDLHSTDNEAFLLLAEVALNDICESNHRNFGNRKPHESIKYDCGGGPNPNDSYTDCTMHPHGVVIPMGKPKAAHGGMNEYVVFNEDQIRLRYLFRVKFV